MKPGRGDEGVRRVRMKEMVERERESVEGD